MPAGGLEVADLRIEFGGLVAVDRFNLVAPTGRITGLIGPNGAGKTTTFNACCGMVTPKHGRVLLDGHDVTRLTTDARARRGLGRTFQQVELFDSLSVAENVRIGAEAALAGMNPVSQFLSRRGDGETIEVRARDAIELCRLEHFAGSMAGALSTGQRRLVELARCLAGPFRILLLDEPSSGLDRTETREFGEILRRVVDERGVGILLVEHDMELVMDVCEHIYVLDFGVPIFDGAPHEVTSSPAVQAAYFGTESAALDAAAVKQ